jgi:hypothetical protein
MRPIFYYEPGVKNTHYSCYNGVIIDHQKLLEQNKPYLKNAIYRGYAAQYSWDTHVYGGFILTLYYNIFNSVTATWTKEKGKRITLAFPFLKEMPKYES